MRPIRVTIVQVDAIDSIVAALEESKPSNPTGREMNEDNMSNDSEAFEVIALTEFTGARPADDGTHVELMVKTPDGTKVISVPFSLAPPLAFTIIRMEEECRRITSPDAVTYPVLTVVATQAGVSGLGDPALTLISDQGLKLLFAFTRDRLASLAESIRSLQELTAKRGDEYLN